MRNALRYYYNIYCTDIIKSNNNYKVKIDNNLYYLVKYQGNITVLNSIYDFINKHNLYCHEIIINKDKTYLTNIDGINYVLLKIHCSIDKIGYMDIANYNLLFNKGSCNWKQLWCSKVDYYEYQMEQFKKKYPILFQSFNYYSGLTENAIMILEFIKNNLNLYVQHSRIYKNTSTLDFYNPINMIIDVKVRDICEYFKHQFFYVDNPIINVKNYLDYNKLSNDEAILFISRMLYPSYYFDLYDEIIQDKLAEEKIKLILNKTNNYEIFLEEVYNYIKLYYDVPEIEWLIKT